MLSMRLVFRESRRYISTPKVYEIIGSKGTLYKGQVHHFMKVLGTDYRTTYKWIQKHKNLQNFDPVRLTEAEAVIRKFGFTQEDLRVYPQVLTVLPASIEHHTLILQECGFIKITPKIIKNYIMIAKKNIGLLKAHGYIPDDVHIERRLASYLHPDYEKMLGVDEISNNSSINDIRQQMLEKYLSWHLEMTEKEVQHLMKTYPRLQHKSFQQMTRSLQLLEGTIGFSKDKIKRNGYLIHSSVDNIESMLTKVPHIGGLNILEVIHKCPKIIMTNYDTLIETSKLFREYGIPDDAIQRCLEVFTLATSTVRDRLEDLNSVPEFKVLLTHPRVLRLVHYQNKARSRLSYLQHIRVKCASLHILSSPRDIFIRYAREGADKTRGKDIVAFLSHELGLQMVEIRAILNRHQYWCHVPLTTVEGTLQMLLDKHISSKHIEQNIHILLYPKESVEIHLNGLLLNAHPGMPHVQEMQQLNHSRLLSLCLYFVEKEHHFTGNGVWSEQPHPNSTSTPETAVPLELENKSNNQYKYGLQRS